MTHHGNMIWVVAGAAAMALAGCTFGDEPVQQAEPVIGNWFDQNCVPAECMFECCDGWKWSIDPALQGGDTYKDQCTQVGQRISAYAEYAGLMVQPGNSCSDEFADFEGGSCYVVAPSDAIKETRPNGQIVYSGLTFLVCPPNWGMPMAYPMEDVELIPQE